MENDKGENVDISNDGILLFTFFFLGKICHLGWEETRSVLTFLCLLEILVYCTIDVLYLYAKCVLFF